MALKTLNLVNIIFHFYICLVYFFNSTSVAEDEVSERNPDVWCKLQPDGYDCNSSSIYNYYFDTKLEDCKPFQFGTCEHNRNKFPKIHDCREECLEAGLREVVGNVSANVYCRLQPDFGLCHEYNPLFYFDVSSRTCKGFSYSGCGGNLNRFDTLQTCGNICGHFFYQVT